MISLISRGKGTSNFPSFTQENAISCDLFEEREENSELAEIQQAFYFLVAKERLVSRLPIILFKGALGSVINYVFSSFHFCPRTCECFLSSTVKAIKNQ